MSNIKKNLISRILASAFYKKAGGRAAGMLRDPKGLLNLVKNVFNKANDGSANGILGEAGSKVMLLLNLVKAYAKGDYRDVSTKTILLIATAFIYFLSPIDLIPDFIPMLGFADDIALLTFVTSRIGGELEKFELWTLNKDLNN